MINKYIENEIETITEQITQIIELLGNNSDHIKYLNIQLSEVEAEQDDLLHEVELAKLNALERQKVFDKIRDVRERRRIIKDRLQIATTIRPISDKVITKGIWQELKQTIKNIETLKNTLETRKYNAKIRKDLKCARED